MLQGTPSSALLRMSQGWSSPAALLTSHRGGGCMHGVRRACAHVLLRAVCGSCLGCAFSKRHREVRRTLHFVSVAFLGPCLWSGAVASCLTQSFRQLAPAMFGAVGCQVPYNVVRLAHEIRLVVAVGVSVVLVCVPDTYIFICVDARAAEGPGRLQGPAAVLS